VGGVPVLLLWDTSQVSRPLYETLPIIKCCHSDVFKLVNEYQWPHLPSRLFPFAAVGRRAEEKPPTGECSGLLSAAAYVCVLYVCV